MKRPPSSLPRLFRTLWYLRREQVLGQVARHLGRRNPRRSASGTAPSLRRVAPPVGFLAAPAHVRADEEGRVRLIGRDVRFARERDWDFGGEGPLWAYHLHQMEWVRTPELSPEYRQRVLLDWMEHHEQGVGWHGGPISIRSFVWAKLVTTPGALPASAASRERIARSWADQLATLAANPERHLLGNHYLWNLMALVLGGLMIEGSESDAWLGHAERLQQEIDEQFGEDGAHTERSPMYHALLLENLLDLLNVARGVAERVPAGLAEFLADRSAAMLGALEVWTHPDGEIALFADAATGIAARPTELFEYAAALGVTPRAPKRPGVLDRAGYVRLTQGPFSLLASVAGPGPSHQPGHAHCDALSFELVVEGERVVTDTGVCEYVPGPARDLSRATASHATLQIEDDEQAELWGAHRIGGRPDVALVAVQPGRCAEAVCAGWATPDVLHRRIFSVDADGVTIEDSLSGPRVPVRLFLPLAPGLEPQLGEGHALLRLPGGLELVVELPEKVEWRIERRPCFPEFGRQQERAVLVGEAESLTNARWRLRLAR